MEDEDAEEDGNDGVDVGVGGDLGDGDVLEQVDEAGIADEGTSCDEPGDGGDGGEVPVGLGPLAEDGRQSEVDDAGEQHLPGGGDEAVDGEVAMAGVEAADGPTEGSSEADEDADQARGVGEEPGLEALAECGREERDHAEEAEEDAEPTARRERLAAGQGDFKESDEDGRGGEDERGEAAGDEFFRVDEADVATDEEKSANHGEAGQCAGGQEDFESAEPAPGEQDEAGDGEAGAGEDRGGELLAADADGGVGGSPEEVDAGEGEDDGGHTGCLDARLWGSVGHLGLW